MGINTALFMEKDNSIVIMARQKVCVLLLLTTLFQASLQGFYSHITSKPSIIASGQPHVSPYTVAIIKDNDFHQRCAGTLISDSFVLTAAQCLECDTAELILGAYDILRKEKTQIRQRISEKDIIFHPLFDPRTLDNDIALIKLPHPVILTPFVNRVGLPEPDFQVDFGERVYITGWEKRLSGYSNILSQAELQVLSKDKCTGYYPTARINDRKVCATNALKETQIPTMLGANCITDAGSPLTVHGHPDKLVGILTGDAKCGSILPEVFVNIAAYRHWIDEVLDADRAVVEVTAVETVVERPLLIDTDSPRQYFVDAPPLPVAVDRALVAEAPDSVDIEYTNVKARIDLDDDDHWNRVGLIPDNRVAVVAPGNRFELERQIRPYGPESLGPVYRPDLDFERGRLNALRPVEVQQVREYNTANIVRPAGVDLTDVQIENQQVTYSVDRPSSLVIPDLDAQQVTVKQESLAVEVETEKPWTNLEDTILRQVDVVEVPIDKQVDVASSSVSVSSSQSVLSPNLDNRQVEVVEVQSVDESATLLQPEVVGIRDIDQQQLNINSRFVDRDNVQLSLRPELVNQQINFASNSLVVDNGSAEDLKNVQLGKLLGPEVVEITDRISSQNLDTSSQLPVRSEWSEQRYQREWNQVPAQEVSEIYKTETVVEAPVQSPNRDVDEISSLINFLEVLSKLRDDSSEENIDLSYSKLDVSVPVQNNLVSSTYAINDLDRRISEVSKSLIDADLELAKPVVQSGKDKKIVLELLADDNKWGDKWHDRENIDIEELLEDLKNLSITKTKIAS